MPLNLNFELKTAEERTQLVQKIINEDSNQNLTPAQLNLLAEYVLWGKDADGKSGHQKHDFNLSARKPSNRCVSLEELTAAPNFAEDRLSEISRIYKVPKPAKFSREKVKNAYHNGKVAADIYANFESLWRRIDEEDFMVRVWKENKHAKVEAEEEAGEVEGVGVHIGVHDAATTKNGENATGGAKNADSDTPISFNFASILREQQNATVPPSDDASGDLSGFVLAAAAARGIKTPQTPYFQKLRERIASRETQLLEKALSWDQRAYLQHRNNLIELRNEQYTLQDSLFPVTGANHAEKHVVQIQQNPMFDMEIPVLPLGLKDNNERSRAIFETREFLNPEAISYKTFKQIEQLIDEKHRLQQQKNKTYFDFEDEKHIYQLLKHWGEILAAADTRDQESNSLEKMESTLRQLLDTIKFYQDFQDLSDSQRDILEFKLQGDSNYQIMKKANQKYGSNYSENYISTIFKKRIIKRICAAVAFHKAIVESLGDDEKWRRCSGCGDLLLLDERNFNKNSRTTTGFQYCCRFCQRDRRNQKKEMKQNELE